MAKKTKKKRDSDKPAGDSLPVLKPETSGIRMLEATDSLQGNHVTKLFRWNALRHSPHRRLFDLLQYALQDPLNNAPINAAGFTAQDTAVITWFCNGGYRSGEVEVDKLFFSTGLYQKIHMYYV